jgi:hypothetical protein
MKAPCFLVMLLIAPMAHADDRPLWYSASEAVAVMGHAADLAATERCRGAKTCHETNRYLARFDDPVAFAAAKFGVASIGLWAARKIPNQTLGAIVNYSIGASFFALGARNERIGRVGR